MAGWSNSNIVRLIRMGENELQALIERVITEDQECSSVKSHDRTFSYRKDDCVIHLQQPGDSSSKAYLVSTLSLCAEKITMLHGSFVHNDSRCMCQLIGTRGDWAEVFGKIVSCRHVQGNVHEICMHFDSAIDPIRYCPEANRTRVLLVEDDAPSTRLATVYLERANADVEHAENGKVAVEKAEQCSYDVIFMDINMPEMDGLVATKTLRDGGYVGTIIALSAMDGDEDRQKCIEAGCNDFIAKPIAEGDFTTVINSAKEEPLLSTLGTERAMIELINAFVEEIPAMWREAKSTWGKGDTTRLAKLARTLKGEAGGYGFDPLSEAADKLVKELNAGASKETISRLLNDVGKWCMLVRPCA